MVSELSSNKMIKCVYVLLVIFLTSSRSFGQTSLQQKQDVLCAWELLLAHMETGPLTTTKELMTEAAFASLMRGVKATEYAKALRSFSELLNKAPLTVRLLSPMEAVLEVGQLDKEAGFYPSAVRLEYQTGKWRLTGYYPSK